MKQKTFQMNTELRFIVLNSFLEQDQDSVDYF